MQCGIIAGAPSYATDQKIGSSRQSFRGASERGAKALDALCAARARLEAAVAAIVGSENAFSGLSGDQPTPRSLVVVEALHSYIDDLQQEAERLHGIAARLEGAL